MGQLLLLTIGALAVGAIGFGVAVLITGSDPGLVPVEPQSQPVPLPADRPLAENDLARIRFDTALRGYRMAQVDGALRRLAYDVGYKMELIGVLEAEVEALREGRQADADRLRAARVAASQAISGGGSTSGGGTSTATGAPVTAAEPTTEEPTSAAGTDSAAPASADSAARTDAAAETDSAAHADTVAEADTADPEISPHRPQEIRR